MNISIDRLKGRSDREFVLRLVLASGSLKDLAKHYGVSYPTIRTRLDKLIERLEGFLKGRPIDPVSDMLAGSAKPIRMAIRPETVMPTVLPITSEPRMSQVIGPIPANATPALVNAKKNSPRSTNSFS